MKRSFAPLLLLAFSAIIYVGNASWPPLVDEADSAYAIVSRELRETGDWAVLHMNGVRWLDKPPVMFWFGAASQAALGESEFSTRLPIALETILLVLLLYEFGRRWFGERAGIYAGLMMCTMAGTFLFTRMITAEPLLALELTGIFYLFLRAREGSLPLRPAWWGASALTALAVLTRGLTGLVFPVAIIALFHLVTGEWRHWRKIPWISSSLVFLALAVPWHVVAGQRAPGFYWFYFVNEHFLRALNARYPYDYASIPRLLWWAEHLIWLFPWIFFVYSIWCERPRRGEWRTAAPGVTPEHRARLEPRILLFLWAGFILLFFSITTRLEYYSFGAWPALALLLGAGLARAEEKRSHWLGYAQGALALTGTLAAVVLGTLLWFSRGFHAGEDISTLVDTQQRAYYQDILSNVGELTVETFAALRGPAGGAALALFLGLGGAWLLRRRGRALAATLVMALGTSGFFFAANSASLAFEPYLSSRMLSEEINRHWKPGDRIVLYGDFFGGCSVAFYTRQRLWLWNGQYFSLEYGSRYPDAPQIFLTDQKFPSVWGNQERTFLVVPRMHRTAALERLPRDGTYLLKEMGGKAVFVNRPIFPNQQTIGESGMASQKPLS